MESRRFKVGRREADEIIAQKGRCHNVSDEYVESIFNKLREHRIKIETILTQCEALDSNRDGVIHADDLIDVINDLLPRKTISRREYHYFIAALCQGQGSNHSVKYMKLETFYEDIMRKHNHQEVQERWYEDPYEQEFSGPRGSIGDFLNKAACPSEIQNYKTLMACLEKYERETGLRISTNDDGFRIPLGPDLKAAITFNADRR
mgnify:CR=1 FL=1